MDDLLKAALVGTATHVPPPDETHPADAAVTGVASDPERSLLLRAGARATWRLAGYLPRRDVPPIEPSPGDGLPAISERAASLLRAALVGEAKELLPEFLAQLAAAGRRLPPELLPDALSPAKSAELRNQIRPVLGERGRWLARLNPDWSWVTTREDVVPTDAESLDRMWEEGTIGGRVAVLAALRDRDPTEGRARLVETMKKEKADVRAGMLGTLAIGLSTEDEPFLEETLDDRSESVRSAAADLLARLPGSRLVARLTERADGMLASSKTGLLRKKLALTCTPPQEIDKEWLRDGVPKDAPAGTGRGKRAVWTEAVLAGVPLGHWTQRFAAAPDDVIAAAAADDFGDAILRGWTRSALREASIEHGASADAESWLRPLADYWAGRASAASSKKPDHRELVEAVGFLRDLLPRLPAGDATRLLTPLLEASGGPEANKIGTPVLDMLPQLPRPWSADLAHAYLRLAKAALAEGGPRGYWWTRTLGDAAAAIPAEVLDAAATAFEAASSDEQTSHRAALLRFTDLIRLRREFLHEVPIGSPKPP